MVGSMKRIIILYLICFCCIDFVWAQRRSQTFDYTSSHFIYPIASKLPGLGTASGLGVTFNNIMETDLDFTGVKLGGEFDVSVISFLNFHIWKEHLVLDTGLYDFAAGAKMYDRGKNSQKDDFILPYVKGRGYFYQLTFMGLERMIELYVRTNNSNSSVESIYDSEGNQFENSDNSTFSNNQTDFGFNLDLTDHRYDPRKGVRLEYLKKNPYSNNSDLSKFYIEDINMTFYIPVGDISTWAFNYFQSDAYITKQGDTDYNSIKQKLDLNCDSILDTSSKLECERIEEKRIQDRINYNRFGRATSLGGSQRLRSFDNARFSAKHARFIGTEFRWNVNDSNRPIDIFFIKGVQSVFQIAFYTGVGGVDDDIEELDFNKNSTGVGIRTIFKGGTVFRADWAKGNEGSNFTLFIDYPWGLNPLDNSSS